MIVALLLMALMQDGPVQTAPPASTVDFSVYAETVRARQAQATAQAAPGVATRVEDCNDPARRLSGEEAFTCASRVRTEAWVRSVRGNENEIEWEPDAADLQISERCRVAANREPNEAEFDCALRLSYALQGDERVGRLGFRTRRPNGEVPAWALDDPAGWERSECGTAGDDACRRQARNRLAMARAGVAADTPASGGASDDGQNCRMVMRRSESGFGGSLSRVCGDEGAVQDLLGRLEVPAQPRPEPCDRPGSLETQAAWIARCQALPLR